MKIIREILQKLLLCNLAKSILEILQIWYNMCIKCQFGTEREKKLLNWYVAVSDMFYSTSVP